MLEVVFLVFFVIYDSITKMKTFYRLKRMGQNLKRLKEWVHGWFVPLSFVLHACSLVGLKKIGIYFQNFANCSCLLPQMLLQGTARAQFAGKEDLLRDHFRIPSMNNLMKYNRTCPRHLYNIQFQLTTKPRQIQIRVSLQNPHPLPFTFQDLYTIRVFSYYCMAITWHRFYHPHVSCVFLF